MYALSEPCSSWPYTTTCAQTVTNLWLATKINSSSHKKKSKGHKIKSTYHKKMIVQHKKMIIPHKNKYRNTKKKYKRTQKKHYKSNGSAYIHFPIGIYKILEVIIYF